MMKYRKMTRAQIVQGLRKRGVTKFQMDVLLACFTIPKGETRSYKQVAVASGHPNAYRAVGSVMRNNPMAPIIPCHRVIKSSGELGNYSAPGGTKLKERMLTREHAI